MEFHELPTKIRSLEAKIKYNNSTLNAYEIQEASDTQEVQTGKGRAYIDKTAIMDLIRSQSESMNAELVVLKDHLKVITKVFDGLIK